MGEVAEVLVTSDTVASLWSACVWDYNSGTCLHSYKAGGVSAPHTLAFIRSDFFIAAESLKPLLHIWPVNSQETVKNIKIVCPGKVSALAISPDGCYCAAGIDEQLYLWQIATGRLLGVVSKHFQNITVIKFTSEGSYVLTAGEDGLILLWPLSHIICNSANTLNSQSVAGQQDPLHTFRDHSLPIRDMIIGSGGLHAYLITVSADCTLKIHRLLGDLLLSVVFDTSLTAVTMNASETMVYVGTASGNIYELGLLSPPRNTEYHMSTDDKKSVFTGHKKSITCLAISSDGQTLASGSADEQVILWHAISKQKIRTIPHKGSVTNILFKISMKNMFLNEFKLTVVFKTFQRSIEQDNSKHVIEVINSKDIKLPFIETDTDVKVTGTEVDHYKAEIDKLKRINSQMYQFMLDKIIAKNADQQINDEVSMPYSKRKR